MGVERDLAVTLTDTAASKDSGRVQSRTVSAPVTATPSPASRIPSAVKVMSGLLSLSRKSAERRCVSRRAFFVSMDAGLARIQDPVPGYGPLRQQSPHH